MDNKNEIESLKHDLHILDHHITRVIKTQDKIIKFLLIAAGGLVGCVLRLMFPESELIITIPLASIILGLLIALAASYYQYTRRYKKNKSHDK